MFVPTLLVAALPPTVAVGAQAQATFAFSGAPESFTVPDAVSRLHVVAVGAPGGAWDSGSRGRGAILEADVAVTPGQKLIVRVGGVAGTYAGGYNGGGGSSIPGEGGGGATDLRTDGGALADRLLAAAGGGGGGTDAGAGGGPSGTDGQAGTLTAGGARGGNYDPHCPAQSGALGVGGAGQRGGGGGWYGGGGGSALWDGFMYMRCDHNGNGGGGSSSFQAGAGVSNVTAPVLDETRTPRLTLSWTTPDAPPSPPPMAPMAPAAPVATAAAGLTVRTPQRGSLIRATVRIGQARSALRARLTWRASKRARPRTVASLLRTPVAAGTATVTLKLNREGRVLLRRKHQLPLRLAVTVTPPTGGVVTLQGGVMLRR